MLEFRFAGKFRAARMLRAIIFDFNGIVLNDEPFHFLSMRDAVAPLGIRITQDEYYSRYLPMDDSNCLDAICRDHSVQITPGQRTRILERKPQIYRALLKDGFPFAPGIEDFIRTAAARYPIALASGARRDEIESALSAKGVLACFRVILGAEDFAVGKPAPASYLETLDRLNKTLDGQRPVLPGECLVIEDSVGGVEGVRGAGMVCLAVAGTYTRDRLSGANRVVNSLQDVTFDSLEELCEAPS